MKYLSQKDTEVHSIPHYPYLLFLKYAIEIITATIYLVITAI